MIGILFVLWFLAEATCPDPDRMAFVPAGSFWMGSGPTERALAAELSSPAVRQARWIEAEPPRRRVTLPAFCIDRFLVSQEDYGLFVAATNHRRPSIQSDEYQRQGFVVQDYARVVSRYLWRTPTPPDGLADHPVVLVSAADAEAYCRWRHRSFRLPREEEWEKAARGTDGWFFPWGNRWDPARLNSAERGPGGTSAVRRYPSGTSPHGLFDAVGNVFQWTASTLDGGRRVLKGCAWDDEAGPCRPAFRHGRPQDSRHILIGFRCAAPVDRP